MGSKTAEWFAMTINILEWNSKIPNQSAPILKKGGWDRTQ